MQADFFKYLTTGEEDVNWGLYLNVAGRAIISPGALYPPIEHPTEYYFNWKQGRVLREYQLNYITEGTGIFETSSGTYAIKPGSLILLLPDVWHRYRPSARTGWIENYIGFNGKIATDLFTNSAFPVAQPVIQCGIKEDIIDIYLKIYELVEQEKPGFQQIASGLILKLLGFVVSLEKQKGFLGKPIEQIIEQTRFTMRQNAHREVDLQEVARRHNVSYSYFRKMFKLYTGVSPRQYHLQLKIIRARELLISSNKSIKEISHELGFQTIHYFSLVFKNKVGVNPSEFRKNR